MKKGEFMNKLRKIGLMILLAGIITVGLGSGCPLKGKDGDDGRSGSSGQDALISSNQYAFTATANPHLKVIAEIDGVSVGAGWQIVTVYLDTGTAWVEIPFSVGDGTTTDVDYFSAVYDGGIQVEVLENGAYNEPPSVGYKDYIVIVQTFNH